jgi:membrane protein
MRGIAAVDGWQRRHAVGGLPLAVLKKFREDRASSLAALVAYYAFLSLFPLLLAFVSILGFVLDDNPSLRDDIVDTALGRLPVIGAELQGELQPLTGSGVALAVGLLGALWAGLGVTLALGRAFAEIWDTPRVDQPGGLKARARGLCVLLVIALLVVAATAAGGLAVGGRISPAAERVAAIVAALGLNAAAVLVIFMLLTPGPRPVRDQLPGVGLAAVGGLVLQSLGAWYVGETISNASAVYGVFALVIGLLSWFWLTAHLLLMGAEVNAVLCWRLWPRALTGRLEPADERALRRSAEAARADERERIAVRFGDRDDRPRPT